MKSGRRIGDIPILYFFDLREVMFLCFLESNLHKFDIKGLAPVDCRSTCFKIHLSSQYLQPHKGKE
jgi:hypothetical protein